MAELNIKKHKRLSKENRDEIRNELWDKYVKDRSIENRNALIETYSRYVHYWAKSLYTKIRAATRKVEYADMITEGLFGLIAAIESYDPHNKHKAKFETYAVLKVKGYIIDWMRKMDWVPRGKRDFVKLINKAREELGPNPTKEEVYQKLLEQGITNAKNVIKCYDLSEMFVRDFSDDYFHTNLIYDDDGNNNIENEELIKKLWEHLNEKEKIYFHGRYWEGQELKDIAKTLGISISGVSRIGINALEKARTILGAYD